MNRFVYVSLFVALLCGCKEAPSTEKHQKKRNNIVNVHDKVKEIDIQDVLIGQFSSLCFIDKYLLITDSKSYEGMVHFFNRNDYSYVSSGVYNGEGPGEITQLGHIGVNEASRTFYVTDHGKQKIFSYPLDSILANPHYMPDVKSSMTITMFPSLYFYINDTLSICTTIKPIKGRPFDENLARWNMQTGEMTPMNYTQPDIERKRVYFDVSLSDSLYVECYSHHDLMTICDLNGNLKYNVYGPRWDNQTQNRENHYRVVCWCGDKIIAAYAEGRSYTSNEDFYKTYPTQFLVFSKEGEYLQTLETGYKISDFGYDAKNNRLVMILSDEIQHAYLDLDQV
ncbi:6-bladed beta-propeller [Phocaeicola sp.]